MANRAARIAGTIPKKRPAKRLTPRVNISVLTFGVRSNTIAPSRPDISSTRTPLATKASPMPIAPAIVESNRLSASS
jgi:hypothetical protein